jgi:Tfp pilus assembly protein PilE
MRRNQSGMTLLSFVIVMAVVGFFLYIVMKLFPMYNEFFSVKTALKGLGEESGIATKPAAEIEKLFFRRLYISYSTNVKPENVHIEQADGGTRIRVEYEVRKPLVANLDVVGKFQAEQSLTGGGN